MIGFYFSPQLKDTESSFLDYLAAFQMFSFFLPLFNGFQDHKSESSGDMYFLAYAASLA